MVPRAATADGIVTAVAPAGAGTGGGWTVVETVGAAAPQFDCPTGAHQAGRGEHAGGALAPSILAAAAAEAVPYFPSAVTPSAF